jgi:hypothetical protein
MVAASTHHHHVPRVQIEVLAHEAYEPARDATGQERIEAMTPIVIRTVADLRTALQKLPDGAIVRTVDRRLVVVYIENFAVWVGDTTEEKEALN